MLKPSPLFTDGAVLCRNKPIRVFGEAEEGASVSVRLQDAEGRTLAEAACLCRDGRFLAALAPQEARTGCRLVIAAGQEIRTAENVAVGEVYLAGGQSNMELALCNAAGGAERIRTHEDPDLRFFNVPQRAYESAEARQAFEESRWASVAPGRGGENSAAAYFFACKLRQWHPEVPVGIIGCFWGGTSVTCWMREETLRTLPEGTRYLNEYAEKARGKTLETFLEEEAVFRAGMDRWNGAVEQYRKEHPDAAWQDVEAACGEAPWCPPAGPGSPYRPGGLAPVMVCRAAPAALTAVLFYQGEEDADKTDRYDELFRALIREWRELFRDAELPFLFVQLPMWLAFGAEDRRSWARLRLAQAAVRDSEANTGMICLLDQGEYGNIHPTGKRPVGERLALLAERMLRGAGEISPRALGISVQGGTLTVALSGAVQVRGKEEPALLEIAGTDGRYMPARAEIRGTELNLSAAGVPAPVRARYAWTDWSDRVNLFGENGLPLEPFDLVCR